MRASPLLATCASLGPLACVIIAPWTRLTGNPVPVAAGIFLAVFLGCAVSYGAMFAQWEMTPSEKSRWADGAHSFATTTVFNLVASVPLTLFAAVQIVRNSAWALVPLLLVSCAAAVLAWSHRRRERAGLREAASESVLTGPKIIGLRRPEQVPRGWVPVVVHRPHAGARDMLVDYRVHVDGDRVGTVGPGESLVVGLLPGPHSVRCRWSGFSSTTVSFVAVPGVLVDLVAGPGGTAATAAADQRSRPEGYIGLAQVRHRVPGWPVPPAFAPGRGPAAVGAPCGPGHGGLAGSGHFRCEPHDGSECPQHGCDSTGGSSRSPARGK
ncbi:hypothetical protein ACFWTE_13740 [Nocardiopsis sp. NPDC058631]|uniref:hypothetical protein n=1 Tax=Nocardiopsis sp. NPDC058631 TaxID=3346566 RepID=UPI0036677D25